MQIKNYCILEKPRILADSAYANQTIFVYDRYSVLRRKNIRNHVEFNDYFATLATILNCIKENYEEIGKNQEGKIISVNKKNLDRLENLKNDLLYLQDNFTIAKKSNKDFNSYGRNFKRKKSYKNI